ncbi:putative tetratricopeptide-like helical protein [Neofusicoccum parvum UCRNP2]|uniref:Putative tetratricopeptide-like helical protein n=1 Tax=Botryosphaeria parva (strain UCR-NP2) TaxID=1287680 RepID=R1GNJ3_BOTPV|nr:putative tetratricopeptide-like helical protein [Neofusicoccum parvum UCRNP2]
MASVKDTDGPPMAQEETILQAFNNHILVANPATFEPSRDHVILAARKNDTPTYGTAAAQSSQFVTVEQLADCVGDLKDMISKIELLQQALPTNSLISERLADDRILDAFSYVKKKLDAVVDSCRQHQDESLTENTKMDHGEPIGGGTRVEKVLNRLKYRSGSFWTFFSGKEQTGHPLESSPDNQLCTPQSYKNPSVAYNSKATKIGQIVFGKTNDLAVSCVTAIIEIPEGVKAKAPNDDDDNRNVTMCTSSLLP